MKIFFYLLVLSCLSHVSQAQAKNIELLCKLENGVDVRYTFDTAENKLYFQNSKLFVIPIISDTEIRYEFRFDGTLMGLIKIDRFTLKYLQYTGLAKEFTKNKDGWISGQCEILKRML
jgi:hypothetical protein